MYGRPFVALLLSSLLLGSQVLARPLTSQEVATLTAAAAERQPGSAQDRDALRITTTFARTLSAVDIVPLLVELKDPHLLDAFNAERYRAGRYRARELESLAAAVAADPAYDRDADARQTRQLLFELIGVDADSRDLFDSVYRIEQRALTDHRAHPEFPGRGLNARPNGLLTKYTISGMEPPLAELVPLLDDACDDPDLVDFLGARHFSAAFPSLRDLYLRSKITTAQCDAHLATVFASWHELAPMQAIAERMRWLIRQPAGVDRDQDLVTSLATLGATPVEAQVDLVSLRTEILQQAMAPELRARLDTLFAQQIAVAQRAADFTPENLAYWLGQDRPDIARSFLDHGAGVNPTDRQWGTPLEDALRPTGGLNAAELQPQYEALVVQLVDRGAHVSEPGADGYTPLHIAAAFQPLRIVDFLVTHGADVNAREPTLCRTPALVSFRDEITLYLLNHGADINARMCDGTTLLLKAIQDRRMALAQQLIDRGARIKLGTHGGITPILLVHMRAERDDKAMEEQLRSRGATLNPLMVAKWSALRWMFERGYP